MVAIGISNIGERKMQSDGYARLPRRKIFLANDGETRFVFESGRLTVQRKIPAKPTNKKADFVWMAVDRYLLTDNRAATMGGPNQW